MKVHRAVVRPYIQAIEALGAEVVGTEETGGNHYKYVVAKGGKRRFFIAGCSPSSHRSVQNFKSEVRKWLRQIAE